MKILLCTFSLLLICAQSVPAPQHSHQIKVVRHEQDHKADGSHNYLYETENGIYEDQQGYATGPESQAAQGQFQYVSPEGQVVRLSYTADENGFQPQGDHLPTPPPIPPAIKRALEFLAKLPPPKQNKFN